MKRLFCIVVTVLLCFSLYRTLGDREPLTLSGFLNILQNIDLDFSSTMEMVETISKISLKLSTPPTSFIDVVKYIGTAVASISYVLTIPVALIVDILAFLWSIIQVLYLLLGGGFV